MFASANVVADNVGKVSKVLLSPLTANRPMKGKEKHVCLFRVFSVMSDNYNDNWSLSLAKTSIMNGRKLTVHSFKTTTVFL